MPRVTGKSIDSEPVTSTWITVARAADVLGVSENTIRSWIRQGRLTPAMVDRPHPSGGTREIQVINPSDLARMPRRRSGPVAGDMGEISARAFELYDEGDSVRKVVVALRIEPDVAAALREQWLDCGGADLVVTPRARVDLERLVGEFNGVAELVERVRARCGFPLGRVVRVVSLAATGKVGIPIPGPARPSEEHHWVMMDDERHADCWRHVGELEIALNTKDGEP